MESIHNFDFFPLQFDGDGKPENAQQLEDLKNHAKKVNATDAIFMAHGFRNDENDARGLYKGFLETFRVHVGQPEFQPLAARRFVVAGVFWPSKAFKESFGEAEGSVQGLESGEAEKREVKRQLEELKATEASPAQRPQIDEAIKLLNQVEDSEAAQDKLVALVLSLLDGSEPDPTEGLQNIRAKDGSKLLQALEEPLFLPTVESSGGEGGVLRADSAFGGGEDGEAQGVISVFGSVFGRIGQFLNLTTWYLMKDRCGIVGASGTADAVSALRQTLPSIKVHLVGHSLGGRLMASCAKSLAKAGKVKVDSLTLLQAAFSHYGLSKTLDGKPGFFREVIESKVVRGPLIATYSAKDTVVGRAYAISSRLAGDNVKAIGDENDQFGGIGRNGSQNAPGSVIEPLHAPGKPYAFAAGVINNLNGSKDLINDHGDVKNKHVTYAFASAVART